MSISEQNIENAKYYGYEAQSVQLMEECAELIQAMSKYRRVNGLGAGTITKAIEARANLVEEIADVEIMLAQMKYFLSIRDTEVEAVKEFKINRTRDRIISAE